MKNKKIFKPLQLLCVVFVVVLTLSGCWSVNEINNLAIVNVMGIDQNDAGEVEVTAVVVKPHTLFSQTVVSGGTESQEEKFLIETASGKSILQAVGKLSSSVSERIYFGHMNVIVFGEKAARERMESSLDFFKRENDFRPNIKLLVTKGTASRIIKSKPQLNTTLGLELQDLTLSNRFAAAGMGKDISQFVEALSNKTVDPITGVIQSAKQLGIKVEGEQQKIPEVLSYEGTAVFKDGKLRGFLDEKETRGLLWIQGELKNEIVVLDCGENDDGNVSLIVRNSKSKITPQFSGQTPKTVVNMQVEADIGEFTCSKHDMNTIEIDRLNKQLEDQVHQEATHVLNKVKNQWQSDIFGFGKAIYRKFPKEWNQLEPQWRQGQLRKLPVDLKVSANISRYGLLKDPIKANESR